MTPDQKEIVAILQSNGGEVTKKQVVEAIGGNYYCNGDKHIGDRLSRMVKSNLLVRVKPGVFRFGTGRKSNPSTIDTNQIKLEL